MIRKGGCTADSNAEPGPRTTGLGGLALPLTKLRGWKAPEAMPPSLLQQDRCALWLQCPKLLSPGRGRRQYKACQPPASPPGGHGQASCSVRSSSCPGDPKAFLSVQTPQPHVRCCSRVSGQWGAAQLQPHFPDIPLTLRTSTLGFIFPACRWCVFLRRLLFPTSSCPHPLLRGLSSVSLSLSVREERGYLTS